MPPDSLKIASQASYGLTRVEYSAGKGSAVYDPTPLYSEQGVSWAMDTGASSSVPVWNTQVDTPDSQLYAANQGAVVKFTSSAGLAIQH